MNYKENSSDSNFEKLIKAGYSCPPPRKAFVKSLQNRICSEFESSHRTAKKSTGESEGSTGTIPFIAYLFSHWRASAIGISCIAIVGVLLLSAPGFLQNSNEMAVETEQHTPSGAIDKNSLACGIGDSKATTEKEPVNRFGIESPKDEPKPIISIGAPASLTPKVKPKAYSASTQKRLKFDKIIPLSLQLAASEDENILKCAWIIFKKEDRTVKADLRLIIKSWPKHKWNIALRILDRKGKELTGSNSAIDNTGIVAGVPLVSENDLNLTLVAEKGLAHAHSFYINITQVNDPIQTVKPLSIEKGDLSLKVTIADSLSYSDDLHEFILWKRFEPSQSDNISVYPSAMHEGKQIRWHDKKTNTFWRPTRSITYKSKKNGHVVGNLTAGDYMATAVNSATGDPTPFGRSDIIQLKNNSEVNIDVPVIIDDTCKLTVKIVSIDSNEPIAGQYLLLRNADGMPITAASGIKGRFTNSQGIKEFAHLAPGNYQLEIGRSGWWNGCLYTERNVKKVNLEVKRNQRNIITISY